MFGRRIRRYMLAYLGIEMAKVQQADGGLQHVADIDLKIPEMSVQLVERLVKVHKSPHKCHRNIIDSELRFLWGVSNWMKRSGNGEEGEGEAIGDFED